MNIILLIISLLCFPFLIGYGVVKSFKFIHIKITKTDSCVTESALGRISTYITVGSIVILIISGVINALSVFSHLSISKAGKIFCIAIVVLTVMSILAFVLKYVSANKKANISTKSIPSRFRSGKNHGSSSKTSKSLVVLSLFALIIAIIQVILVLFVYRSSYYGNQTLETVVSFINTDQIYSVDPLTGTPFTNGHPLRLSLQCLPFFYTVICNIFSLTPITIVWKIMPAFWMICSYFAIYRIADSLFKTDSRKMIMLICFELLLWCSNSSFGSTGYNIFHIGYSEVTVLEIILIFWTIGTLLSHTRPAVLLSIIAEPLIASTRFGIGACFFITLVFIVLTQIPSVKRLISAVDDAKGGSDGKN